jgi:hypothetical protein
MKIVKICLRQQDLALWFGISFFDHIQSPIYKSATLHAANVTPAEKKCLQ